MPTSLNMLMSRHMLQVAGSGGGGSVPNVALWARRSASVMRSAFLAVAAAEQIQLHLARRHARRRQRLFDLDAQRERIVPGHCERAEIKLADLRRRHRYR